jgi:hypothetical protein
MSEDVRVSPTALDTWFELLSEELRRRVVFELARRAPQEATLTVPDDIVRADEDAEAVSVHLRHVHLPKLADSELVDWDRDARTVSHGRAFDRARPLVRALLSVGGTGRVED